MIKKNEGLKKILSFPLFFMILLGVGIWVTINELQKQQTTGSHAASNFPTGFMEIQFVSGITNGTAMEFAPDGRLFIAQQGGQLRVVKNGQLLSTPFLTVPVNSSGERGLLGIAFDPDFTTNNYIYIYYTTSSGMNRISRFTANGDVMVAGSESVIMDLDPHNATNHNGGAIHFGIDGKLYAAAGDNATGTNAQIVTNLHGKILRLNPVSDDPNTTIDERIPTDNPISFVTTNGTLIPAGRNRAIWALGLRNPFTFDIQPGTGKMYINDVGDAGGSRWEEVNDASAGDNFGWPVAYGNQGQNGFERPIYTYQADSCAITGGSFYNPSIQQFPATYVGKYFFADYCGGWIKVFDSQNPGNPVTFAQNISSPVDVKVGFDGALYYLARGEGSVYKVIFEGGSTPTPTVASCIRKPQGDADCNGIVNIIDLSILASTYNSTTELQADFNNSDVVDIIDLSILASNYGT